ncbi:MAG: efflux RND transporter periplasmic adaptor subunit [Planctomycetota bacterium]|jgi:Cu(I)/Ag(I) efflux system membrane fusion protein
MKETNDKTPDTGKKPIMKHASKGGIVLAIGVAFLIGYLLRPAPSVESQHDRNAEQAVQKKPQQWTCSMHPQFKLPKKGLCPICNMDLIPLEEDDTDTASSVRQLTVSENARKLMDIETAPVERKFVTATVRMVGKIDYDETKLASITAWVPGRLDRLFVDYTGVPVRKGDHMVYLYSPDLLSAQEELIQALIGVNDIQNSDSALMRDITQSTVEAARDKLRLLGLTDAQVATIEKTGKAEDHVTIYAPTGGIVVHKNALEGQYVKTGTKIYTIADLSQVWVYLDAYESDLQWIRYGQQVEFTTVAYPGEVFKGTIAFIDPVLDDKTRTIKVRVNVANPDGKLKPKMFVKATVQSQVAGSGRVMNANLAGKWICPMHPDIIKEEADKCDICEMPLVRTESIGYVSDDPERSEKPLVIPVSAALITGTRAIVYVEVPGSEKPTFEGRQVVLGPRAGDYYLVRSGLTEGEQVVVKGSFKIDSSLQIMAKPSMMSPDDAGGEQEQDHRNDAIDHTKTVSRNVNPEFRKQLADLLESYYAIQQSLAGDNAQASIKAFKAALESLKTVDMTLLSGQDHDAWMKTASQLNKILTDAASKDDIQKLREEFHLLSQNLIQTIKTFGVSGTKPVYILNCPMAFDNAGANWLQDNKEVSNPYFGDMMLRCGSVEDMIPPITSSDSEDQ